MAEAVPRNVRDLSRSVFGRLRVVRFEGLNHRAKARELPLGYSERAAQ